MHDRPKSTLAGSRYQLIAGRFQLLAIGPTATTAGIEHGFAIARKRAAAPEQVLADARDAILDPAQHLLSELASPLDSAADEAKRFYAALSDNVPVPALLPAANDLPVLSRANLLALLAGREAPDAKLLVALVEAHAAVDAAAIFEILRDRRSRAGFPPPSLVDIRQGLRELLVLHVEAVIAAYVPIQSAAGPLLECVRHVVSSNDRYRREALSTLLDAYRQSLAGLTNHDLDAAFIDIKERPDDSSIIGFGEALNDWISPIAPLILFDAHQMRAHDGLDEVLVRARNLLADIIARGDHETAHKVAIVCFNALRLLPEYSAPFEEAALALRNLSLEAEMRPLEASIQNFMRQPQPLIAAIGRKGFGNGSTEPARTLWEAFSRAVTASHATELHERPWMAMRGLAYHLHARPESAKAASRMISDLVRFAETLPSTSAILEALHGDLITLEAGNRPANPPGTNFPARRIPYASIALLVTLSAAILSAVVGYRQFHLSASPPEISAKREVPEEEPQAIPPVSKGERYKRSFVRYCHFQEERLRIIKQHVRGPGDIQAYNMLANDHNSRCSNFYYLDEDLKVVTEELKAKKQALEADAMLILSTWPWHSVTDTPDGRSDTPR